jgi:GntR family transcriptional regulator
MMRQAFTHKPDLPESTQSIIHLLRRQFNIGMDRKEKNRLTNGWICTILLIQMINSEYKKLNIRIKLGFGSAPVYQQIVEEIIHLIASGELTSNDRLPPVRELAKQLEVNPNTVAKSYNELAERKLIISNKGGGTYFSENPSASVRKDEIITSKAEKLCSKIIAEAIKNSIPLDSIVERLNMAIRNREALNE